MTLLCGGFGSADTHIAGFREEQEALDPLVGAEGEDPGGGKGHGLADGEEGGGEF